MGTQFAHRRPGAFRFLRFGPSAAVLAAVNLIPAVGIVFYGWDVSSLAVLYWVENLVVGGYTVLRIALVRSPAGGGHASKLFAIPFFIMHFGGFCMVHGLFLTVMLRVGGGPGTGFLGSTSGGFPLFALLGSMLGTVWRNAPPGFVWAVLGLAVSHGISFVQNDVLGEELLYTNLGRVMTRPYRRIAVLHVAILLGGAITLFAGSPLGLLIVLLLLKVALDVALHVREHRSAGRSRGRRLA